MDFLSEEKIKYIIEGVKIVLLLVIFSFLIYGIFFLSKKEDSMSDVVALSSEEKTENEEETNDEKEDKVELKVDLKGAVKKPGVYTLNKGSIIDDLIKLGGGVNKGATLKNVNLSKKLEDEMVIYIYTEKELNRISKEKAIEEVCTSEKEIISNCEGSSVIVSGNGDSKKNKEETEDKGIQGKVSINTASVEELMTLSGIGESKAKAIVEYRTQNGAFKKCEDIMNVTGIGESVYQKIKDNITV